MTKPLVHAISAGGIAGFVFLQAACSDAQATRDNIVDAGSISTTDSGSPILSIEGQVSGSGLDAHIALFGIAPYYGFRQNKVQTQHSAVTLAAFEDQCGSGRVEGSMLYLDLFDNPSRPTSVVEAPGTFTAWVLDPAGLEAVPVDKRFTALLTMRDSGGGMKLFLADDGVVEVTKISSTEMLASFHLTFPGIENDPEFQGGTLAGSFEAKRCDRWVRNAIIPGTSATPP